MEIQANGDGTITMDFNDLQEVVSSGKTITKLTLAAPCECEKCGRVIPSGSDVRSFYGGPVHPAIIINNGAEWPAAETLSRVECKCICLACAPRGE